MARYLLTPDEYFGMKKFVVLFILMFSVVLVQAQTVEKEGISKAILAGDAAALGKYFTSSVDITLKNVEDVYSRDQAEVILKRFFSENKPASFVIKHEGKSKREDFYYIGELTTDKGNYRLSFFLKKEEAGFRIKQLRIESGS